MSTADPRQPITVEAYLAGEPDGEIRHEYVAGHVYAMTGGSVYHNRICLALASTLREMVKGRSCDVFMADMKLRTAQAFYYPDIMVVCDPTDTDPYTRRSPLMIAEVVSPNTRSIDEREKRVAYQCLESLKEYVLIEQDRPEVRITRRGSSGAWTEDVCGPDDVLHLQSLELYIAMRHLYEGTWR